jgi:hypothetical protein
MIEARTKTLGRLACRIVVGIGIYVVIVVLATPLPPAAGLMLTFPALNGLAFYFSEDARAASIARTMFWMPMVNGALCAGYLVLFLLLAGPLPPTALGWGLLLIAAALWFAWVTRRYIRAGIDPSRQSACAIAMTFAGVVLAAVTMLATAHSGILASAAAFAPNQANAAAAVAGSKLKIALFALTLAILVSVIQYVPISDSTRGILAGLPIVPFGGLVSIAGDASLSVDARIQIFRGMMAGLWLGPAVAIWYIFYFSRFLTARRPAGGLAADALWRFGALWLAWLVTFAVLVGIAYALSALGSRDYRAL